MQAILITAYKNYFHLENLVDFFNEDFSIYIHIDKKSSISKEEIRKLKERKNVAYISQQYTINWGGINHLKAILDLSVNAIKNKENQYFHLITGHDYPIKPISEITAFAHTNREFSYMEYHPLPYSPWPEGGLDRLSRYNLYDLIDGRRGLGERFIKGFSKVQKALGFKRSFEKDFPSLYGGSTYWSLNREALEYVFQYMLEHPQYLKRFKYSFCSEEIFFQTILLNSPLKGKIINDNMRFIIWEERNGNFPANLDDSDFNNIKDSNALFARKFEFPISENLLKKIQQNITKH
jgi:hypothetical protein